MMNKRNKPVPKAPAVLFLFILICAASLVFTGCSKKRVVEKKQIILISVDTLRGDHLSAAGYFRDTSPHLSRLIEDSVYYTRAYPNGCWTPPSHMSLLTGTLPSRHGINTSWRSIRNKKYPKLNESVKNVAEILKVHRISTIKHAKLSNSLGFGNGFGTNRNVDPFHEDEKFNRLVKDLEKNKANDFFLFIHTWKVHAPYGNSYFLEKGRLN
ncbi:MAG: sulfatase-like hydrolase/transferase, partial [bacterium]|nr:sulfatase-like hydrolase/transferase [bacterium]